MNPNAELISSFYKMSRQKGTVAILRVLLAPILVGSCLSKPEESIEPALQSIRNAEKKRGGECTWNRVRVTPQVLFAWQVKFEAAKESSSPDCCLLKEHCHATSDG